MIKYEYMFEDELVSFESDYQIRVGHTCEGLLVTEVNICKDKIILTLASEEDLVKDLFDLFEDEDED